MACPKRFFGSYVGVKLPKDVDLRLRAASLESGRSISDLIRETLAPVWGKVQSPQQMRVQK